MAISLALFLICGVSFADTDDQTQVTTGDNTVAVQAAKASDISSTAKKGNARTLREFISPLRKNRIERRVDRRAFIFGSDKQDTSSKTASSKVNQSS
ncbi:hypothetical protein CDV26_09265 [Francisella halioticida]|uniref:RxLR effector protein n=1 Tax=Francisella halioticida TaxID=549298 RepID=A0ABM6M0Z1_9GAMM|nr:hypothetical protein [Francisella halioticida]ASG68555.1 hypothetical protein CDV26_09265 [Francisella halioticida]